MMESKILSCKADNHSDSGQLYHHPYQLAKSQLLHKCPSFQCKHDEETFILNKLSISTARANMCSTIFVQDEFFLCY